MFNVYLANRFLASFPKKQEASFLTFCSTHNLTVDLNEAGDYILFPQLKGITVALCPITNVNDGIEKVVTRIGEGLTSQGALVLYASPGSTSSKLLKILKVQILLSFSHQDPSDQKKHIRFYYSLRKKEESLLVIGAIIKQLARQKQSLAYDIPGFCKFLSTPKYFRYFTSDVPTVLMEIANANLIKPDYLEKAIAAGLIDVYGRMIAEEKMAVIQELVKYMEQISLPLPPEKIEEAAVSATIEDDAQLVVWNGESNTEKQEKFGEEELISQERNELKEEPKQHEEVLEKSSFLQQEINLNKKTSEASPGITKPKGDSPRVKSKKKLPPNPSCVFLPPGDGPFFQFVIPEKAGIYPGMNMDTSSGAVNFLRSNFTQDPDFIPRMPWENHCKMKLGKRNIVSQGGRALRLSLPMKNL